MNYYYSVANTPLGPVPLEDLHTLYRSGVITLETLVVAEGGTEWKPYSNFNPPAKGAAAPTVSSPPPQSEPIPPSVPHPTTTPASSQPSYKNLVLISWILLGATALLSVIPVVGCLTWVMLIPVFIATTI